MEYMILNLPISVSKAEEMINEYAEKDWRIICSLAEHKLILGREKSGIITTYLETKEKN